MVGVVGSNPIVPTKHCHLVAEKKGDPKGSPFFVSKKMGPGSTNAPGSLVGREIATRPVLLVPKPPQVALIDAAELVR